MAFSMKVAQGTENRTVHVSAGSGRRCLRLLHRQWRRSKSEQAKERVYTGWRNRSGHRHEKTYVKQTRYTQYLCAAAWTMLLTIDAKIAAIPAVDYERLSASACVLRDDLCRKLWRGWCRQISGTGEKSCSLPEKLWYWVVMTLKLQKQLGNRKNWKTDSEWCKRFQLWSNEQLLQKRSRRCF